MFPTQKKLDQLNTQTVSIRKSLVLTPRKLMSLIGTLDSLEKKNKKKNSATRKVTHEAFPVVPKVALEISPVTGQKDSSNREFPEAPQTVGGSPKSHGRCSYPSSGTQHTGVYRCLTKMLGSSLKRNSGLWSNNEAQLHINVLELKAVLLALKGFLEHLQGQTVLICSDNSTVISYLNKEGGTHSIEMCALIWRILAFTNSRRIQIRARHVPGSLNVIADSLSRRDKIIQTEWSLHQQIFNQICKVWHTIYVSPVPDKKAWKIDALNICWEGLDGYIFCPVAILPQVIQKIITYPCRMIVLAPGWPGMPWFWDLEDLSTRVPLQLPLWKTLVKQPHSNRFHNNVEYLNRVASGFQESNSGRFSSEVAERIKAPQRESSRKVYQSRWSIYGQWCTQNKVDITSTTVPQVAEFLNYLFTVKNLKPATITGYRTAIADALGSQGEFISKSL